MEFKEAVNNSWRVHKYNVANIFQSAVFAFVSAGCTIAEQIYFGSLQVFARCSIVASKNPYASE